jgi:ureidoacrylate peracid hydrolase
MSKNKPETSRMTGPDVTRNRAGRTIVIEASPSRIEIQTSNTAVIVVDMQNDFGSEGGMFDQAGIALTEIRKVIAPISVVVNTARASGLPIIYAKMAFRADLSDLGVSGSPNRERHLLYGVGNPSRSPDGLDSRILIRDTWNSDIIPELEPHAHDVVFYKHRYSAFYQTELDAILKQRGIRNLIFTGCTTSVCVESTIRDAFYRDYSCLLLADCTAEPIGTGASGYRLMSGTEEPRCGDNYTATLLLVRTLFGWVADSDAIRRAFSAPI